MLYNVFSTQKTYNTQTILLYVGVCNQRDWLVLISYKSRNGMIHPPKTIIINCPPSVWQIPLTTEGVSPSIHQHPLLLVAELQCTGLYRAGEHPGCCL
ncbi:hypothetical protein JOB18_005868 [Solea senegalensis]|nr:hypothetical protein JOB18_005868 [Solea senegalensis]